MPGAGTARGRNPAPGREAITARAASTPKPGSVISAPKLPRAQNHDCSGGTRGSCGRRVSSRIGLVLASRQTLLRAEHNLRVAKSWKCRPRVHDWEDRETRRPTRTIRSIGAVMLTDRNGSSCPAQMLAATFMSAAPSGCECLRVRPVRAERSQLARRVLTVLVAASTLLSRWRGGLDDCGRRR